MLGAGFHESAEQCSSAAFEQGLARMSDAVQRAAEREERWLDRLRAGLVALLGFLEDEPIHGRSLLFHGVVDRTVAFRYEQRVSGVLSALLDDGSPQAIAELTPEPQLTAELIVGGVVSVIRARMRADGEEPLVELAPSLMSFIVVAYLGQATASAELAGSYPGADAAANEPANEPSDEARVRETEPAASASCAPIPVTHRTTLALGAIARAPRSSNREIAAAAGIGDEGQTSHLLRRLAQRGLIEKVTPRSGSRRENAWLLTPSGRRVIELLNLASAARPRASVRASLGQAA